MSEQDKVTARYIASEMTRLQNLADKLYRGRRVRFVGAFNGQPLGRSRKSLAGTEAVISSVYLSDTEGVTFHSQYPKFIAAGFTLTDVEFL